MKIEKFEDIIAWQKALDLTRILYRIFKPNRDFGFRNQILRATVSIMNNIAEGYERKGNKELRNFLFIAKGSCAEVRSMLYVSVDLNYISNHEFDDLFKRTEEISKLLSGFIKTLS